MKNLVTQLTTERPSEESKNLSNHEFGNGEISQLNLSKNQIKGYYAEAIIIELFESKGWILNDQRKKINHVEIDLFFKKEQKIVFIEVKYLDFTWRAFERIKKSQLRRLKQTLFYLRMSHKSNPVLGLIAFVGKNKKVKFISLDEVII